MTWASSKDSPMGEKMTFQSTRDVTRNSVTRSAAMIHSFRFRSLLFSPQTVNEMIANPFETRSDSFYFVDNSLVMHNKADYAYDGGLGAWMAWLADPIHCSMLLHGLFFDQISVFWGQQHYFVVKFFPFSLIFNKNKKKQNWKWYLFNYDWILRLGDILSERPCNDFVLDENAATFLALLFLFLSLAMRSHSNQNKRQTKKYILISVNF